MKWMMNGWTKHSRGKSEYRFITVDLSKRRTTLAENEIDAGKKLNSLIHTRDLEEEGV